jgi:hypothetical protein
MTKLLVCLVPFKNEFGIVGVAATNIEKEKVLVVLQVLFVSNT